MTVRLKFQFLPFESLAVKRYVIILYNSIQTFFCVLYISEKKLGENGLFRAQISTVFFYHLKFFQGGCFFNQVIPFSYMSYRIANSSYLYKADANTYNTKHENKTAIWQHFH